MERLKSREIDIPKVTGFIRMQTLESMSYNFQLKLFSSRLPYLRHLEVGKQTIYEQRIKVYKGGGSACGEEVKDSLRKFLQPRKYTRKMPENETESKLYV